MECIDRHAQATHSDDGSDLRVLSQIPHPYLVTAHATGSCRRRERTMVVMMRSHCPTQALKASHEQRVSPSQSTDSPVVPIILPESHWAAYGNTRKRSVHYDHDQTIPFTHLNGR